MTALYLVQTEVFMSSFLNDSEMVVASFSENVAVTIADF